jgi:hypothetical protein
VRVTIRSDHRRPVTVTLMLGSQRALDAENPAAKLWADRRISALQDSPRDRKREVIALSRKYTVVSNFTALLAIPAEELARYRRLVAEQSVHTNTHTLGGGGGDPFISVKAPSDAQQVVAIFPDGTAKNLDYDSSRNSWTARFDLPLGTPAGDYDVTIVITHADGQRTRLILIYTNLLSAPKLTGEQATVADDGGARRATVEISGDDIAKATVVAPWGEREPMDSAGDVWSGTVTPPQDWPSGETSLSVICYDGAHNRSEVQIDVDLR